MEQIYTIPVNEAVAHSLEDPSSGCPICTLYKKLEHNELDAILGPAMMEPDIRIQTNKEGFCHTHYHKMLGGKNRLALALMLESHLEDLRSALKDGMADVLFKGKGTTPVKHLSALEGSCYVCRRIEDSLSRMIHTFLFLWQDDPAFRDKVARLPHFCLPHYRRLLEAGKQKLSKKDFVQFYDVISFIELQYLETLTGDVSWFCKKFDYRYGDEPWYNAKDSIERTIATLGADEGRAPDRAN